MPEFDPTIPMGVQSPQPNLLNPIETMTGLANAQRTMLDAQQMKLTLGAKAKAGAIMANAPDLDTGIHELTQDPEVAGFVPDIINTLQAVSASQVAVQGERQGQAISGLNSVFQGLLSGLNDPTTFDANVKSRMATLSPSAQQAVIQALPNIKAALFDGLPADPAAAGATYQQRLAAMIVGSGFGPEGVRAVTGTLAPQVVTVTGPNGEPITMQVGGPMTGPGGGPTIMSGPGSERQHQLNVEGQVAGDTANDMANAAQALPETLITLQNTTDMLSQMQTGGGADLRMGLGKALQFFKNAGAKGISQDLIDQVANGNLAASETLVGYLRNFVTGQLRVASQGTGAGRIKSEVDAYLSLADQTTDPKALLNFLNLAKQQLQLEYDRSQTYPDFKKALEAGDPEATRYGPAGFYQWYNAHHLNTKGLPETTPGGENIGPTTPAEIGKAAPEGTPQSLDDIFGSSP